MKTNLLTIIFIAMFVMSASMLHAQFTYQTARRFIQSTGALTDSNVVLQPGVQTGCALITAQPVWGVFGICASGTAAFTFNTHSVFGSLSDDSLSVVIYGPFTDTLNLSSKLVDVNIDTCFNAFNFFPGMGVSLPPFYYTRGDIYVILMMTNPVVFAVDMSNDYASGSFENDTAFCTFCNSKLSELYQPLCTVTYDSASQKNKIIWPKDIFTPAQDYVVFRQNASATFDTIAYQSVTQLSEFIDSTSSPMAKSNIYKLGIRDSCGQLMNKNYIGNYTFPKFTTMHLIAYPTGNNSSGLIWNTGSYTNYQTPYLIYRTDPSGVTTLIDSVANVLNPITLTYTDINAPAGFNSYQIGVSLPSVMST